MKQVFCGNCLGDEKRWLDPSTTSRYGPTTASTFRWRWRNWSTSAKSTRRLEMVWQCWRKSESTKSFTVDVFVFQKWRVAVWTYCNYVQWFSSCDMHPVNEALVVISNIPCIDASPDWTGCLLGWKGCLHHKGLHGRYPNLWCVNMANIPEHSYNLNLNPLVL